MGRKIDKYRLRRDPLIPWQMLETEAFRSLSATGIRVLIRFLQKRNWHKEARTRKIIFHNSGLAFTYAEANYMDISTSQFHTVLKKLLEVGFIDIEHQGGGLARDYSRYAVSDRWRDYGTDAFKAVEKKRVLWKGYDVRARINAKNKATENRSCQLREIAAIERK
jgi:DNA-binding PadR family transcriptional regulator